jgi:hypothetical protein
VALAFAVSLAGEGASGFVLGEVSFCFFMRVSDPVGKADTVLHERLAQLDVRVSHGDGAEERLQLLGERAQDRVVRVACTEFVAMRMRRGKLVAAEEAHHRARPPDHLVSESGVVRVGGLEPIDVEGKVLVSWSGRCAHPGV